MPRETTDVAHLWDMLHAARGIESAVASLELEHYLQDEDLRMSVERRIEIIGEAARRVSDACKVAHPGIPWRRMISQRNVLAHEYDEVDDRLLWRVVTESIPQLVRALEGLVTARPPPDPEPSD
jgi:uncharacterized protein with HEPN domain